MSVIDGSGVTRPFTSLANVDMNGKVSSPFAIKNGSNIFHSDLIAFNGLYTSNASLYAAPFNTHINPPTNGCTISLAGDLFISSSYTTTKKASAPTRGVLGIGTTSITSGDILNVYGGRSYFNQAIGIGTATSSTYILNANGDVYINGNVGISTAPGTFDLNVNGNINGTKLFYGTQDTDSRYASYAQGIGTPTGTGELVRQNNPVMSGTLDVSITGNAATANSCSRLSSGNSFSRDTWYKDTSSVNRFKFASDGDGRTVINGENYIVFNVNDSQKSYIDSAGNYNGNITGSSGSCTGTANYANSAGSCSGNAETSSSCTGNANSATRANGGVIYFGDNFQIYDGIRDGTTEKILAFAAKDLTKYPKSYFFMQLSDGHIYVRYNNGFWLDSDIRIKKNITNITNDDIINKFLMLKPKLYNKYIDKNIISEYGFIANDVENIFPEVIDISESDYIPNIFSNGIYDSYNNTIIIDKDISTILNINDKIKIVYKNKHRGYTRIGAHNNSKYELFKLSVTEILTSNIIKVDNFIPHTEKYGNNIFIYGTEVTDLKILNYNSLFTINIAATQNLYSLNQSNIIKIQNLTSTIENQNKIIYDLEKRLLNIEAKLNI